MYNLFVSWRATCSFFREALAQSGAKRQGGSYQPPLCRVRMRNGLCRRGLMVSLVDMWLPNAHLYRPSFYSNVIKSLSPLKFSFAFLVNSCGASCIYSLLHSVVESHLLYDPPSCSHSLLRFPQWPTRSDQGTGYRRRSIVISHETTGVVSSRSRVTGLKNGLRSYHITGATGKETSSQQCILYTLELGRADSNLMAISISDFQLFDWALDAHPVHIHCAYIQSVDKLVPWLTWPDGVTILPGE